MKLFSDPSYIESYTKKHRPDTFFSNWDSLKKELVFYQKDETIYAFEDAPQYLYLLVKGSVRIVVPDVGGNDTSVTTLCDCTLFGEIEYLLRCPAVSTASAHSDAYCIRLPFAENETLLQNDCRFYRHTSRILAERMTLVNTATIQKARLPLAKRLARYLLEHYDDSDEISDLKPMCEILHCSYRQLLRVLKQFCRMGALAKDSRRGIYHLENADLLTKL